MKLKTKILSAAAIAALAAITVLGARELAASQAGPIPVRAGAPAEPGVVRFAVGAPQLSSLKVVAVAEVPMPVAEPSNGRISYDENVTARISSPIAGRVTASRVEIGDRVGRGATLLEIDAPELASADADWHKARADETYKKLAFERARNLLDNEVIARKEYEAAAAEYQQAAAETRRASLRMKNLNASGNENGRFALKAPLAGVVADKQVNPGLEVRPDLPNPLLVVTDINRLWVIVDLPERSLAGVRPGQALSIETDAYPNERFAAKVERVGLALDPETRRVQVRGAIANPEHKLKPEMFARVAFLADNGRKGVRVPNTSLIADGLYSYLFVERETGVFEKRRVNVALKGHDSSFIDQGIAGGDRVVTEGALLLNSEVGSDAQ